MVAEINTVRKIAHAIGITSATLIKRINDNPDLAMKDNWIAHEELSEEEATAIINSLTIKEILSDSRLKDCLTESLTPKLNSWRTLGHAISNIKYLTAVAVSEATKGFRDRSKEYEEFIQQHKLFHLEDLNLELKFGNISTQKKIEFLTIELYEIARKIGHADEHMKVISFLIAIERESCRLEMEEMDRRARSFSKLLSIAVLATIGFVGSTALTEQSEKFCHPGGDAIVYRDSPYCNRIKAVEEFFVGLGVLK